MTPIAVSDQDVTHFSCLMPELIPQPQGPEHILCCCRYRSSPRIGRNLPGIAQIQKPHGEWPRQLVAGKRKCHG